MEQPHSPLPYSQAPATCPYPEPTYIFYKFMINKPHLVSSAYPNAELCM